MKQIAFRRETIKIFGADFESFRARAGLDELQSMENQALLL